MALTPFQRSICQLIAANRKAQGESYVAGGAALNTLIEGARISRDIDLFHDTREAMQASWNSDRAIFEANNYEVNILVDRPGYVEARIARGPDSAILEWAQDSAYRFFPLLEHAIFGLVLHPFDLATNKVLALIGRAEPRDWVDVLQCDSRIQPLGYLAWAASGKDPAFSPACILEHAARTARYSEIELAGLDFEGARPTAADQSRRWHAMRATALSIVNALPAHDAGKCVVDSRGELFQGGPDELARALDKEEIGFHSGSICGALPAIRN